MIKSFIRWLNGPKDAEAQFDLGVRYATGRGMEQNHQQAVKWYHKAARKGHAIAQFNLGVRYANGQGVEKDYQQAIKWYRKAAKQGYALAQYNLGVSYAIGQGVEQDYQQAIKWYRKAAEQGYAKAQYNLGVSYAIGQGVEQDYQQAKLWYQKAAEQGYAEAQEALRFLPPKPSTPAQSKSDQSAPSTAKKAPTQPPKTLSAPQKASTPSPKAPSKPNLSLEEQILNYLKAQPISWEFPPKNQDDALKNFCSALVFSENVTAIGSDENIRALELTIQQKRARNPQLESHNAAMDGNILALLYKYSYLMHIFPAIDAIKFDTTKVDIQKLWLLIQQDCNARIGNLAEEKRKNPAIQTVISKYALDHQTMNLRVLNNATGREMDYIISTIMSNSLVIVISLLFSNPQLLQNLKPYSADDIMGMMDAHISTAAALRFAAYSRNR